MGILQNLETKKELMQLFLNGKMVFNEINSAIQPVRNVYYHYESVIIDHINRNQDISIKDIIFSLLTYENYINQLFNIKQKCDALFKNNPKLSIKFSAEYESLNDYFNIILERINLLIKNINKFDDYNLIAEFNVILSNLQRIRSKMICQLNKSQTKIKESAISNEKTVQI